MRSILVGPEGTVELPPIPEQQALVWLGDLLQAWHKGMTAPLPVACKTAFAWLAEGDAQAEYQGGYNRPGEVEQDPYLARAFPNFESLFDAGFTDWADRLYQPLWQTWHSEEAA